METVLQYSKGDLKSYIKKAITRKWLQHNPNTLEEIKAIVIQLCKMETLTLSLKN